MFRVSGPLTPDPSPPLSRGRGEECVVSWSGSCRQGGGLTRSREAAKGNAEGAESGEWRHPCCTPGHCRTRLACWRFRSSGFPARAHCCAIFDCVGGRFLVCHCPLTPDPSRPFHGGEGRNMWSGSCRQGGDLTRSREAAKGNAAGGGCWRPSCRTPRHRCSRNALRLFRSSGFPARAHCCAILIAWMVVF